MSISCEVTTYGINSVEAHSRGFKHPSTNETRGMRFQGLLQSESVLLVDKGEGLLLTCDAIQHYGDYLHNTLLAKFMMPFIGFPKTTIIGPIWLKLMTPEGASLESEFTRLLELPFDGLLSAHGSFLSTGAHQAVEAAFNKIFSN